VGPWLILKADGLQTEHQKYDRPNASEDDNDFRFIHLSFQEYFAAKYFVQCWIKNEPVYTEPEPITHNLNRSYSILSLNMVRTKNLPSPTCETRRNSEQDKRQQTLLLYVSSANVNLLAGEMSMIVRQHKKNHCTGPRACWTTTWNSCPRVTPCPRQPCPRVQA